ncbi:hypothetical protein JCM9279_004278 [Rhodotorula babjevae]
MTASETAPRDDGGSSSTFDDPPRFATPLAALAPEPISFDWAPASPQRSSSGSGRTSLVWKGRMAPPFSDDWVSPRRPHKRVCRRPSPDDNELLFSPARPPRPGSPHEHSAARPSSQHLLDKQARLPSTAYLHEPDELAFYSDRSSDSDEASIKAPSQPLSDAETSGENQLRRTAPPPRRFARLTLSPIANMDWTDSSPGRHSGPSASSSATSARSTAPRRTSSPACATLADDLSALRLASTSSSRWGVEHDNAGEPEGSSSDEYEGASLEEEQEWRFEECPIGSFASTGEAAW